MVICIWYCYGFCVSSDIFFSDCVSPKGMQSICKEKKMKCQIMREWIHSTVCGRPLNITFVALLGTNYVKEKNAANGNEDPHPPV